MKRTFSALTAVLLVGVACAQKPNEMTLSGLPPAADEIPITSAFASNVRREFPTRSAYDGNHNTWWSSNVAPQWIVFDVGTAQTMNAIALDLYRGENRVSAISVEASDSCAAGSFRTVLSRRNVHPKPGFALLHFNEGTYRCLRVIGYGNSENSAVAIREAKIFKVNNIIGVAVPEGYNPDTQTNTPAPITGSGTSGGGGGGGGETSTPTPSEPAPAPAPYRTNSYFVDCAGSDTNTGRDENNPWRTISKINNLTNVDVPPGTGIYLKRGCTWSTALQAKFTGEAGSGQDVYIGSFGTTGENPRIRPSTGEISIAVTGKFQTLENLRVTTGNVPGPYPTAVRCPNTPRGWRIGFSLSGTDNTVRYSSGTGLTAAFHLAEAGRRNRVLYSEAIGNTIMSVNTPDTEKFDDDSGAWAFLFNGNDNEVGWNYTSANYACSEDYGIEGAAMEVYLGDNNLIHHNRMIGDTTFTELGGRAATSTQAANFAENNKYVYNVFSGWINGAATPRGEWLVVRGLNSKWGANPGTKFVNNTGYYVDVGVACVEGCGPSILDYRNNIVVGRANPRKSEFWADAQPTTGGNVFWRIGGGTQITNAGAGLFKNTDPLFVNAPANDFNLTSNSPARAYGIQAALDQFTTLEKVDLANLAVPQGVLDSGAYEGR